MSKGNELNHKSEYLNVQVVSFTTHVFYLMCILIPDSAPFIECYRLNSRLGTEQNPLLIHNRHKTFAIIT